LALIARGSGYSGFMASRSPRKPSVQVDVKFVRVNRQRCFQYTALDDCTRFRVLRLYRHLNHRTSLSFFRELREAKPFPIGSCNATTAPSFRWNSP
jgi:hypothetical protein